MQIGRLLAHGLEDRFFVAVLRKLGKLDSSAMGPKPADHPPVLEEVIGITLPHRALEQADGMPNPRRKAAKPSPLARPSRHWRFRHSGGVPSSPPRRCGS